MPDWMPGSEYYTDFKHGDPYTKVEMGEARLPGAGYEVLHRLHSGIPKVYDAVDRFLILSDIAPYSKQYTEYRYLAMAMTRKDPYWSEIFKRHIQQRRQTQEEYEFLDLNAPEDIPDFMKPMSTAYRHAVAGLTGAVGTIAEPATALWWQKSPFAMAAFPISKFFPYKTAEQTYKDYRLYGAEFTDWGSPIKDFIRPMANRDVDLFTSKFGVPYVPPAEKERREYEDYFDKLQYIKYKKLSQEARALEKYDLAKQFEDMSEKTLAGVNEYSHIMRVIGSIPKRERAFAGAFSNVTGSDRETIRNMVSPQMARIYEAQWAMKDHSRGRARYDPNAETTEFFKTHHLPGQDWLGWHPDVDIRDVQLKVVKNEGMDIHNFDLWESQERAMARKPYVPTIDDIHKPSGDLEMLKKVIQAHMQDRGYSNTRLNITRTPASQDSTNLKIKINRNRDREQNQNIGSLMYAQKT